MMLKYRRFPNRPRNTKTTLFFRTLCQDLLDPLQKLSASGSTATRPNPIQRHIIKRKGPYQQRGEMIERFIQHWRKDVGPDLYPVLRLILPDKDNDRFNYGIKEQALGRLLVKILGLDPKRSDDARRVINWTKPIGTYGGEGNFPGICYSALKARSMLTDPGSMTIGEVNELLDQLSVSSTADERRPILKQFYHRMNAAEMTWMIRIILKQMKIGTGHEVFLRFMHEGAPSKWSSTSSLRTVCWTLYDETCAWDGDVSIKPFDCFQPQLCKQEFQGFEKTVERMCGTSEDPEFWIQEKLDGERMQMHMAQDPATGGRKFAWYSRNGTNYTGLYGESYKDPNSSMTRYLENAFPYNIENIILDGEMIAWDPLTKGIIPFGTLKTVALDQAKHPEKTTGARPLFKVFDCVYANNKDVTKFTLRDRRNLLEQAVKEVRGRMEFLNYWKCTKAEQIEEKLRQVIAESSEGIVVKNPRAAYTLTVGSRSEAWMKIKPEYMMELGEHLDCVVIGAYYGSGSRGGGHSSFMVGLRESIDPNNPSQNINPQKCWSFVKVGGGFSVSDYQTIKRKTEGKWHPWDRNNPPKEFIELAGGHLQHERPDEWIKPEDSVVIAVKAAQVATSDRFATGVTLRFPRFKSLKEDRDWSNALSVSGFIDLQNDIERHQNQKKLEVDRERQLKRRKTTASRKKTLTVIGAERLIKAEGDHLSLSNTGCFTGLEFCVMTDMERPAPGEQRMSKRQLEEVISTNGGTYWASPDKRSINIICVADKKPTNVYALMKKCTHNIVRPAWIIDCVRQSKHDRESGTNLRNYLLPLEAERHLFFAKDRDLEDEIEGNIDEYGDSYHRDLDTAELKTILSKTLTLNSRNAKASTARAIHEMLETEGIDVGVLKGLMFAKQDICFYSGVSKKQQETNEQDDGMDLDDDFEDISKSSLAEDIETYIARQYALFGGATVSLALKPEITTHIVISPPTKMTGSASPTSSKDLAKTIRLQISSSWKPGIAIPRIVSREWIQACWTEGTLVDEERFVV